MSLGRPKEVADSRDSRPFGSDKRIAKHSRVFSILSLFHFSLYLDRIIPIEMLAVFWSPAADHDSVLFIME